MKITVYTITDCKFSQAEKQYLQSRGLQFEEKNLEANREYLTEMLNISNNFAGTPVTKIEKDDGQIIVLKGFTQDEFDKALAVDPNAAKLPMSENKDAQTGNVTQQVSVNIPPAPPIQPQQQPISAMPPTPPMQGQPPLPPTPPTISQPDMMQPPVAQPTMAMPQQPMSPPPAPPVYPTMDMSPPQPAQPQGDQALNSVLQNLQDRAGDTTQQ